MRSYWTILILLSNVLFVCKTIATEITVVTEVWPPYNYLSPEGEIVGLSTNAVKKTLAIANIPYTLNIYPWARSYNLAQQKPNVLIYSLFKTPMREKLFHWICPITLPIIHYVLKIGSRQDINIKTLEDLKKYRISVTRNTFPHEFLVQNGFIENKHFFIVADNLENLRLLLNNKVDFIIEAKNAINQRLIKAGYSPNHLTSVYELGLDVVGENCMALSLSTPQKTVDKIRSAHQKTLTKNTH